jgi:lactate permease
MAWTQNYTPIVNVYVSALVAAIPVIVLLGLLAFGHVKAHWAALAGLASAMIVALTVFGMPLSLAVTSAAYGALFGLFPIGWIVLNAIFLYNVAVSTGQFEVLKNTIAGLAGDRRIQVLLIGFSFGAFMEGAAGFGTPVAISAAMLIGLGFRPLQAAGLTLIGNTAPVAFGALGTPLITLTAVTGLPLNELSAMVGRQLPFFSLLIPFWIVWAMCGRRKMWEVWPACLVCGGSFALSQFFISNFIGPSLVDIVSSITSIIALVVLLRFWQPHTPWRFEHDSCGADPNPPADVMPTRRQQLRSWMPWAILSLLVFIWSLPAIKNRLDAFSKPAVNVPYLHNSVVRVPPVSDKPEHETAVFTFNWLTATGTSILLSAILSGLLLGMRPAGLARVFGTTLWSVRMSLLTIALMLGLGYCTKYAGLDSTMGLAVASTGVLFPFFSPLVGWLGVALTGSDTSSNVLFGNLQQVTARQLGISPILTAAANSSGGVMGKMIDAQSIVVANIATAGASDKESASVGQILRYVFFHSVALAILMGILVALQATVLKGMIP